MRPHASPNLNTVNTLMPLLRFVALLWLILNSSAQASPRLAILDFELNDLTLAPRIPAEIARTASIKPLLEQELNSAGYPLIKIPLDTQAQANAGFGYLFEHHDLAAELARKVQADYILVGRLHKPSFLFAYLIGHLIRADNGQLVGNYTVESKGGDPLLIRKAVETLTDKIDQDLEQRYQPPPPPRRP